MKEVIFYSYPKCSTCIKAAKWLEKNNINYRVGDKIRFPRVKEIKKLEGGPKIIKKITDGDGNQIKGFSKIGVAFKKYILEEKYDPLKLYPVIKHFEDESSFNERENLNISD